MNGIMKVFSDRGTHAGMKWYIAGKVALSKKPISTRMNKAMPKELRQATGTSKVKAEGIATLNANTHFAPYSWASLAAGIWPIV